VIGVNVIRVFNVYLKGGEMMPLEFRRFHFTGSRFIVYDSNDSFVTDAFISFDNVAAIIPQEQEHKIGEARFKVYMKDMTDPLEIVAHSFSADIGSNIIFWWGSGPRLSKIEDVYIARSEVLAIMPAEGIDVRRKS
jgi:hypothetical protein